MLGFLDRHDCCKNEIKNTFFNDENDAYPTKINSIKFFSAFP